MDWQEEGFFAFSLPLSTFSRSSTSFGWCGVSIRIPAPIRCHPFGRIYVVTKSTQNGESISLPSGPNLLFSQPFFSEVCFLPFVHCNNKVEHKCCCAGKECCHPKSRRSKQLIKDSDESLVSNDIGVYGY